jgi:hypothetical protein
MEDQPLGSTVYRVTQADMGIRNITGDRGNVPDELVRDRVHHRW